MLCHSGLRLRLFGGPRPCTAGGTVRAPRRAPVRCSAAPEGGVPRGRAPPGLSNTPSSEDIKKAILGFPADGALQGAGAAGAAGVPGAGGVAVPHDHAPHAPAAAEPGSWEDWKLYLEGLDDTLLDIQTLYGELDDAVRREDFRRAAELKAALRDLEKQDVVGGLLQDMDTALAEERYGDAAVLRDAGGVGMLGWWAGRGEDDYAGHLIKITPEFGRYLAQAYTARELAELAGWSRDSSLGPGALLSLGPGAQEAPRPLSPEEMGLPVFELAVRRDGGGSGELQQQAVALFTPGDLVAEGQVSDVLGPMSRDVTEIEGLEGGTVTVETDEGGEVRITVEIEEVLQDDPSNPTPITDLLGPDADGVVSIDQLAGLFPSAEQQLPPYEGPGANEEDDVQQQISDALRREEEAEAQQAQRRQQGDSSGGAPAPDSFEGIMARIEHGDEGRGGVELPLSDKIEKLEKFHLYAIPDDDEDEDGDEDDVQAGAQDLNDLRFGAMSLHRAPAQIEWHGRDSFTIRASPAEALAAAADAAAAAAGGPQAQPAAGREEDPAAAAAVAVAERLAIGGEATDLRQDADPAQASPPESDGTGPEGERPEGAGGERGERLQRLESEVQQWAKRRGAKKEQIEAILKATMAAAIAQGIGAVPAEQQAGAMGLEGQCTYTRIPTEHFCKTDPFSGLYWGSFGPHGPELLQLVRVMVDGEEWVQATKIIGDRNVPAGQVTFRAKVGRGNRLTSSDAYPMELGVKARYRGQGRVAQEGFVNAKWVEGELLQLSGGNPMTNGAELGFVYNVDGVKRFLILFSRLDLGALGL